MVGAPALAVQTTYTFDIYRGTFHIDVLPDNFVTPDPVTVPVGGALTVTINDDEGQLGAGDTFTLGSSNIYNTTEKVLNFVEHAGTATFPVGETKIEDFHCPVPGQISQGALGTIDPDVYVTANLTVAGVPDPDGWFMNGDWEYASWRGVDVETFNLKFHVDNGVPVGVWLRGKFTYTYTDDGMDLGDFTQTVEIEAGAIPEPGCTGLIALALAAAGKGVRLLFGARPRTGQAP